MPYINVGRRGRCSLLGSEETGSPAPYAALACVALLRSSLKSELWSGVQMLQTTENVLTNQQPLSLSRFN